MEHYFIEKEHKNDDFFEFTWQFEGADYVFKSCDDVFSKDNVDYGTYVLLRTILKKIDISGDVLDIGCGYGPIGIVLSKSFSNVKVTMTDVNGTAVALSQENAKRNNAKNVIEIKLSNAYENIDKTFDFIVSNPPIKAGKKVLLNILLGSYDRLNDGGNLIFVIKKKFGEDSVKKELQKIFKSVEVIKRDSGYYILSAKKWGEMKTITKVVVGIKDKSRVNLYLDDKFFCSLDMETAVKNSLKAGTIITEEKLEQIILDGEKQSAYTKALKLVSTRYKTQREVEKYLYDKGYLPNVVYYVITKLNEYHFIDDERYVNSYIASHRQNNGKIKIKQQLMQKGVSESLIESAYDDAEIDQTAEIQALAEKYMKNKEDTKENYIKLFKYLMNKGFIYEDIKSALKKEIDDWIGIFCQISTKLKWQRYSFFV